MNAPEPASRLPVRPAPIQPWAVGLAGVLVILVLLVALTI